MIHQAYLHDLLSLPISMLRFTLIAEQSVTLSGDLSSMLRGAMGWAMSDVGCLGECHWIDQQPAQKTGGSRHTSSSPHQSRRSHQKSKECTVPRCPYARSFLGEGWLREGLRVFPASYRISGPIYDVDRTLSCGDELTFTLTLFGEGAVYAPLWINAMIKAATMGLTRQRAPFYVADVQDLMDGESLYRRELAYPPRPAGMLELGELINPIWGDSSSLCLKVVFHTPLLLKNLKGTPSLSEIVRSVLRRAHALHNRYLAPLEHPLSGDEIDALSRASISGELTRQSRERYSSSHQRKVPQNGGVGTLSFSQLSAPDWVYYVLCIGQWIGIGQQANLGLGRYDVEVVLEGS